MNPLPFNISDSRLSRLSCFAACAFFFSLCSRGVEVTIDASAAPKPPQALSFPIGGKSPVGREFSANTRYLTLDGRPWFPLMGEFHYTRYPADEWEAEILKMKAGGLNVIASYVFWIHHEETEGKFDWSGRRDLRKFVQLCAKHGMFFWLRIGPWDHGEARNGGFPDWLVKSGIPLRQSDPRYLDRVQRLFGEIAGQVRGLFWKDGGPIVGVQIENEYHPRSGGIEHMLLLQKTARELGLDAPFFTATGWDNAAVPPANFLPVFGGYTEQFWSGSLTELPPNQNFFFTPIRAEDNVMGDLTPKNPVYNSKYDDFPYLTAEMGGGMAIAYHRRPIMAADDSTAAALVRLGSGISGLGYYMYHGGTNPDGLTPLQETQAGWNGYNDMEEKSYDFQAPLGEFGQVNPTYRTLKILHLFLGEFGATLAPMAAYFPAQRPLRVDDVATPRVTARSDGRQAFVFINNYQRNHPLPAQEDFRVALTLPGATLKIPRTPTRIPAGAYTFWPVNQPLGSDLLEYATAEPLGTLADPDTVIFSSWPGLKAEFSFRLAAGHGVESPRARISREGDRVIVDNIEPGTGVAFRLSQPTGKSIQVVVLSRAQALDLYKLDFAGRPRFVLSSAGVRGEAASLVLSAREPRNLQVSLLPAVTRVAATFRDGGADGVFRRYTMAAPLAPSSSPFEVVKTTEPAATPPVKLSPTPRAVAIEPDAADFERAAVWKIRVPPESLKPARRTFLQISYEGDVARLFAGSRFDNDNFFKGTPWEIALWRFSPAELERGLELKILPLRKDAPVFLERRARPDFGSQLELARVKTISILHEYEAVFSAN